MNNTEQQPLSVHIGKHISDHLKASGMTKSEFARRIGTSTQNVYGIIKRATIDTQTLLLISSVLQADLFRYYTVKLNWNFNELPNNMAADPNAKLIKQNEDLIVQNELLKELYLLMKEKLGKINGESNLCKCQDPTSQITCPLCTNKNG